MFPTDVVIAAWARTPMVRYTGAFSDESAIELATHASKEAIRRSGVDPGELDHAIFGNVMQTSADAIYGARTAQAFIGAVTLIAGAELSEALTVRAAKGFSQNRAKNAAIRSQAIIAQKTFVHEPVFSNNHAAPNPAKSAPMPLAV